MRFALNPNPLRLPHWWREGTKPCACGAPYQIIEDHVGYSDFYYMLKRCEKCGHEWCTYLEG